MCLTITDDDFSDPLTEPDVPRRWGAPSERGCNGTFLVGAGDAVHGLPASAQSVYDLHADALALASLTVAEAAGLEAEAEALAELEIVADRLLAELVDLDPNGSSRRPAEHFAVVVQVAAELADRSAQRARTTIRQVVDLSDTLASDDEAFHDEVLEQRSGLSSADDRVALTLAEAGPSLRHLSRLALAVASGAGHPGRTLWRLARSSLRQVRPDQDEALLRAECPELWSTTCVELELEVAGLLAHAVADHRTLLRFEHKRRPGRSVGALMSLSSLYTESVDDDLLPVDDRLTDTERAALHRIGWGACGSSCVHDTCDASWVATWSEPVDVQAAARQIVTTLVEVHGLTTSDDLRVVYLEPDCPFEPGG